MPRTLSAALNTEMIAASNKPYIKVEINSIQYFPKLLILRHHEEPYRDFATIVLDNHDRAFDSLNLKGQYFEIAYGHETGNNVADSTGSDDPTASYGDADVNEFSYTPGLWVKSQQIVTGGDISVCQLYCEGIWMFLRELKILLSIADAEGGDKVAPYWKAAYDGTTATIYDIIEDIIETAFGFTLDALSEDDGIIDSFQPTLELNNAPYETAASVLYERLLLMTKSYLRWRAHKRAYVVYPQDSDSVDWTLFSDKAPYFYSYQETKNLTVPNTVAVYGNDTGATENAWPNIIVKTAVDTTAKAEYGGIEVTRAFIDGSLITDADVQDRADALLTRQLAEEAPGNGVMPHHHGIEMYDRVEVKDSRGL